MVKADDLIPLDSQPVADHGSRQRYDKYWNGVIIEKVMLLDFAIVICWVVSIGPKVTSKGSWFKQLYQVIHYTGIL